MPFDYTHLRLKDIQNIKAMKLNKIKAHIALSSPSTLQKALNLMDIIHFGPKFTNCLQSGDPLLLLKKRIYTGNKAG